MARLRTYALFLVAVALATVFGVFERVLQDHSTTGWYLANVAGVWLTVAFAVGALATTRRQALVFGLVSEVAALGGFYGYMHFGDHFREPHHVIAFWTCLGLLAGPVLGLVGYCWRRLRSEAAGLLLGALFVGEAAFLELTHARPRSVILLESLAGIALATMLAAGVRWRKRHAPHEHCAGALTGRTSTSADRVFAVPPRPRDRT